MGEQRKPLIFFICASVIGAALFFGGTPSNVDRRVASDVAYDLHAYAEECKKELGEIPTPSCLEGQIIPVFNSDANVEITDKNFEEHGTKCDKPSLLRTNLTNLLTGFSPCVPYTRMGRPAAQEGFNTHWVWTCRRYFVRHKDDVMFDDINMIGHNKDTGATCFFVSHINRKKPKRGNDEGHDGTKVPAITSKEGLDFWKSPEQMSNVPAWRGGSQHCTDCHDNDPFIYSPFIQQVKSENGKSILPRNPYGKYYVVGSKYFNDGSWDVKRLVSKEASSCLLCHFIGSKRTCGDFAKMSVGLKEHRNLTETYQKFHWMPVTDDHPYDWALTDAQKVAPVEETNPEFIKAVKFINNCCKHPKDEKCKWEQPPRGE